MILNDRQIHALCEVPIGYVTFAIKRAFHTTECREPVYLDPRLPNETAGEAARKIVESLGGIVNSATLELYPSDSTMERRKQFKAMIEPFIPYQMRERSVCVHHATDGSENDRYEMQKMISAGLSSFGYDLRLGHKFKVFTNMNATVVDPKNFDNAAFVEVEVPEVGGEIIIPPNSFILGYSLEYIRMPDDVAGQVLGKSTIARMGINCLATPLEPGWCGNVTLEFSNSTPLPAKLYVGEGACQVLFHKGERPRVTYGDRGGKYQNQAAEPVVSKL